MNSKRMLILSFHYTPDLSACSFRTKALVEHLSATYPDVEIDLVTTFPSRYVSYSPSCIEDDSFSNVKVHRVELPLTSSGFGFISEVLSFYSFAMKARSYTEDKEYDLVFGTSAKLATATLARFLAKRKSSKLYLDIRDLFLDNIQDMFPRTFSAVLTPLLKMVEIYTFKGVDRLNIVSEGFLSHVNQHVTGDRLRSFTNGIDDDFSLLPEKKITSKTLKIVYAGNIGRAQSLENIIPDLAEYADLDVHITVVGDGRNITQIVSLLTDRNIKNVTIDRPVSRKELVQYYQQADVLFLHLDNFECLTRVIPSKVFEYAATGLPMLCGVSGYTKQFIETNIPNALTFTPNDVEDCVKKLNDLTLGITKRGEFCRQYSRHKIMQAMTKDIGDVLFQFDRNHNDYIAKPDQVLPL